MSVSSIKPDEALKQLQEQEQIVNALVESQVILQLLVSKGIVTREEVANTRDMVRNNGKYKVTIENIEKQKRAFKYAQEHPEEYLKAMFNAKLN